MKKTLILIISIILILSCNKSNDKTEVAFRINSEINGQTFLNGNYTSEDYSPRGSFIEVVPSKHRFWTDIILSQNKKKIIPKRFFVEEKTTFLFDSLTNGEYHLKFISHLNDEVNKKILLNEKLKIEFPDELENYYELNEFDEFSIKQINLNDTLQILYQHFGCYSFDHKLIEYILGESMTTVRVADWANNWEEVKIENPIDTLDKLIKDGKKFNGIEGCSNNDFYTFRIKGKNKIFIIQDGSCNWSGINMILKKENWH